MGEALKENMDYSGNRDSCVLDANGDAERLECRVYSDLSQIETLSASWNHLLEGSACNPAFASPEWYLASCRMSPLSQPYLVVGTDGKNIRAILALVRGADGVARFPHYCSDYNDMVVRTGDLDCAVVLLRYAMSPENGCHQIILSKLKPDSNCIRAAAVLPDIAKVKCHSRNTDLYRYIELPSTFDEYLASRGKLFRRNVRRALRNENRHGFVIRELNEEDFNAINIPEVFIRMVQDRHKEKSPFRKDRSQFPVKELLRALFSKGMMRIFAILEKERITAMDLHFVTRRALLVWNGGFLPEIEYCSPGTTLLAFAIRHAIAAGLEKFDFGDGDEDYKERWTNKSYWVSELTLSVA